MTDCDDIMLEIAQAMERGEFKLPSAKVIQLDDYRKTPRRAVAHEIAMGPRVNAARDVWARNLEFEKWKRAFMKEVIEMKLEQRKD